MARWRTHHRRARRPNLSTTDRFYLGEIERIAAAVGIKPRKLRKDYASPPTSSARQYFRAITASPCGRIWTTGQIDQ